MRETDGEIYGEDRSWDGDVLANIGVGFCQVQGEKPPETTVIKELWLVQGRRGTNPLKSKSKIEKEALPTLKECDTVQVKRHEIKPERHEVKPAWVVENCMKKGGHTSGRKLETVHKNKRWGN